MTHSHPLIRQIGEILSLTTFEAAPVRPHDPLGGLMAYKEGVPKYQFEGNQLIGLNLAQTGLTDAQWAAICALEGFVKGDLQAVNLSGNALAQFSGDGMTALVELNLRKNDKLARVDFPATLPGLKDLDVSHCKFEELKLEGTPKLRRLLAHDNQIKRFETTDTLINIEHLDLRNNPIQQLSEQIAHSEKLRYLFLYGHQLDGIPKEVIPGGERDNAAESLLAYLREKVKPSSQFLPLHQARMILVGNGEVGKSSIRVKLLDLEAPLPLAHERTNTLEIETYPVPNLSPELTGLSDPIDFRLDIWDFGGQGKYREIQQLFCGRKSLYLFVTACDDRQNEKNERDEYVGFEYWLAMINAYNYDAESKAHSPVIHVTNKIDLGSTFIDEAQRNKTFPNVSRFIKISCEKKTGLADLAKLIREALPDVGRDLFTDAYPTSWMAVKVALENRASEQSISYETYLEICKEHGVNEEAARGWIDILDRIGTVIFFGDHPQLKDWVILNPLWIREIIYQVLTSHYISGGVLIPMYIPDVWPGYDDAMHDKFLALMQAYDLCYARKNEYEETEYLIPARLRETAELPSHLRKDPDYRIRFIFDPFVPAGTVNKLIVHLNRQRNAGIAADWPDEQKHAEREHGLGIHPLRSYLMWKNNLVLHDPNNSINGYAHIQEQWDDQAVYLNLYDGNAESLYERIQEALIQINKQLTDARYLSHLSFTAEGWYKDDWEKLATLKKTETDFFATRPTDRMKKKRAFFMYASQDDGYRAELDKHLASLKRSGKLDTWFDHKIEPGQEWDAEIKRNLQQSDIFLLMLSPDFMNSRYIWEVELQAARKKAATARIIPIFLRACDLEDVWFTARQGAGKQKGWIASIESEPKRDEAWVEVVKNLRRVLTDG